MVSAMFHGMRRKPLGALGALLIIVLVATALLAPVLAPYDPIKMRSTDRLMGRSTVRWHHAFTWRMGKSSPLHPHLSAPHRVLRL